MDRCRCDEYRRAVQKLKIFTPGCYRPDIIESQDRSKFKVKWIKHAVTPENVFESPVAMRVLEKHELPGYNESEEVKLKRKMWCPYMTKVKRYVD